MTLSAGTRLGPYEILSPLGAGGMGEVWRARDTRLSREVAIKVLPEELSSDPGRLRRFEREAQAASALTHPNIVTIYEVASADGIAFIAMELVEGKTLRESMGGAAMPFRKLLAIAPQIAEGLAKAHESGIVHRDLKPENVMVTREGLVKVLDFGLAKLAHPEQDSGQTESALTVSAVTRPGLAMGTAGYMSPEQASGHPVDFRSDQFSFGSMLYEMATGTPAFKRPTTAQTLAAIIDEEPKPMPVIAPGTPAPLRWIVERCLSKEPDHRYAATRDLVRDLSILRDHVSELSSGSGIGIEPPPRRRWRSIGLAVVVVIGLAGMLLLGRGLERAGVAQPRYRQLTFRGAGIGTARFAPDGQTIVYSSELEGRPPELLALRLDSPETRPLGLPPAQILSISKSGQMALLLLRPFALQPRIGHIAFEQLSYRDSSLIDGTLAEASLSGGAPRELLEDVSFADWTPDARTLAIVHRIGAVNRVEFPPGTPIAEKEIDLYNHPRLSSRTGLLAFKDWGSIAVGDPAKPDRWTGFPGAAYEIAWSDATGEIWYTTLSRIGTQIRAVTPSGRDRLVVTLPGDFVLYDVARDGRVLLGRLIENSEILGTFPDERRERNFSYFDNSIALDLSKSGDLLLFSDVSRFLAENTRLNEVQAYVRKTDGSPPKVIGSGNSISPDERLVLVTEFPPGDSPAHISLIPTGPGQTRNLDLGKIRPNNMGDAWSRFFPDGRRIYFPGREPGRGLRVWALDLEGGKPRAITPEGTRLPVVIGDGRFICARASDSQWNLYPVEGDTAPRRAVGILPGEEPLQSTPDGLLYVRGADELRAGEALMTTRVYRLDPFSGRRELWKEIPPASPRSGGAVLTIFFSADGKKCVWTHMRYSTELVLVEGLK